MLSRWLVATYKTLVEVALWTFLIVGALAGLAAGSMVNQGFLGFIIGAAAAFFGMAVFLGAALLLGEIQKSVKDIQAQIGGANVNSSNPNRPDPVSAASNLAGPRTPNRSTGIATIQPAIPSSTSSTFRDLSVSPPPQQKGPWVCKVCGELHEPQFDSCWKCGTHFTLQA